ncbi:hypothetical protein VP01_3788g1, partial [Puccinia sorghi]
SPHRVEFRLLSDVRNKLEQDPLGQGQSLTVKAQVAHKSWAEITDFFQEHHVQFLGAIDGTHIPIAITPNNNWEGYINRKNWASIVFECVVDVQGDFCCICGGGPESMHKRQVFRQSRLGQMLELESSVAPIIPPQTFFIGNASYPRNMKILIPYPSVVNPGKIEFGGLKNQFQILLNTQIAIPTRARENYFAFMILHNLLNHRGSLYVQDWEGRTAAEACFAELPKTRPEVDALIVGPNTISI